MRKATWLVVALVLFALTPGHNAASAQGLAGLRRKAEEAKKALELKKAAEDSAKAKAVADSVKRASPAAPAAANPAPGMSSNATG